MLCQVLELGLCATGFARAGRQYTTLMYTGTASGTPKLKLDTALVGKCDESLRAAHGDKDPQRGFQSTHWSMVIAAGGDSTTSAVALARLCEAYWYPLYGFVRRRGFDAHQAADLTQGFFAELLQRRDLRMLDPQKGRFRAFLLAAIKNYIANQLDHEKAIRRGGEQTILSIDAAQADQRFSLEPAVQQNPDAAFLKQWALALIGQATAAVRAQYSRRQKLALYDGLQSLLAGGSSRKSQGEVCRRLGMSETAVKVALHRLRQRIHDQIRNQIRMTVDSEQEIDAEIQELFEALRST